MKYCRICLKEKSLDDYYSQPRPEGGRYHFLDCKDCTKKKLKEEYTTDQRFDKILKYRYDLTRKQYEDMKIVQGYLCALCGEEPNKWCVDHNHDTGQVRGLLCNRCNTGLGKFKDSIDELKKAIYYLETH